MPSELPLGFNRHPSRKDRRYPVSLVVEHEENDPCLTFVGTRFKREDSIVASQSSATGPQNKITVFQYCFLEAIAGEKKAETGDRTRDSLVLEGQVGNVEETSTPTVARLVLAQRRPWFWARNGQGP